MMNIRSDTGLRNHSGRQDYQGILSNTNQTQNAEPGKKSLIPCQTHIARLHQPTLGNYLHLRNSRGCAICLSEIDASDNQQKQNEEEEDAFIALSCLHNYHQECIEQWFEQHNDCPSCRTDSQKESALVKAERFLLSLEPDLLNDSHFDLTKLITVASDLNQHINKLGSELRTQPNSTIKHWLNDLKSNRTRLLRKILPSAESKLIQIRQSQPDMVDAETVRALRIIMRQRPTLDGMIQLQHEAANVIKALIEIESIFSFSGLSKSEVADNLPDYTMHYGRVVTDLSNSIFMLKDLNEKNPNIHNVLSQAFTQTKSLLNNVNSKYQLLRLSSLIIPNWRQLEYSKNIQKKNIFLLLTSEFSEIKKINPTNMKLLLNALIRYYEGLREMDEASKEDADLILKDLLKQSIKFKYLSISMHFSKSKLISSLLNDPSNEKNIMECHKKKFG